MGYDFRAGFVFISKKLLLQNANVTCVTRDKIGPDKRKNVDANIVKALEALSREREMVCVNT